MKVQFDLPDHVWWRLADADIPSIVVGALEAAARTGDQVSSITALHSEGLCDADIGLRLGMTVGAVASARRRLGLAPNRRFVKDIERKAS